MGFSATWSRLLAIVFAVQLIALRGPSQLPRPDTPQDGGPAALIGNDAVSSADNKQGGARRAMVFRSGEGSVLPVRAWNGADPDCAKAPETPPRIVVAVHGMNDRAAAFDEIAEAWSFENCRRIYAYDQRGFGRTVNPDELWPGTDLQVEDLVDPVGVILAANQRRPITVVGESMGAAVVLLAPSRHRLPTAVDGAELIVHGTEDTLVAPQVVPSMPKNCAALCWVDGGSHLVTHETPGQHVRAVNCRDRERPRQLWQTRAAWIDGSDTPSFPCLARPPSRLEIEALNPCGTRTDDRPQPEEKRS